jgi:hypothetical protein
MKTFFLSLIAVIPLILSGCSTIPNGGFVGDVSKMGLVPGVELDTIRLGKGLLVQDVMLDPDLVVQAQISKDELEKYEDQTQFEQILTIGRFSKILGSGFAKKKDIFYRKRIWHSGRDIFEVDGGRYLVEWTLNVNDPITYLVADMYTLTFRPLHERAPESPAPAQP